MLRTTIPGDSPIIAAADRNAMSEVARAYREGKIGERFAPPIAGDSVRVHNATGQALDRYSVVGLAGPTLDPKDSFGEFSRAIVLNGRVPNEADTGRFAVLFAPTEAGGIVRAAIDGACIARVKMIDDAHRFADIEIGATVLASAESGTAAILWVQPEADRIDGVGYAIIRFGGGGGGQSVRRAIVTGYSSDDDHYVGKFVDAAGEPLHDDNGDDLPEFDLWCWKYGPNESAPIYEWIPPVRVDKFVPIEAFQIGNQVRWYIEFGFTHIACTKGGIS